MRRTYLLAILSFIPLISSANTRTWTFDVYLDDSQIGTHQFTVSNNGNLSYVNSVASYKVPFLFFTAYQYHHSSNEIWRNGCLQSIRTETDDNGDKLHVQGSMNGKFLQVRTGGNPESLGQCVKSFAYWNPEYLKSDLLLNPQNGKYLQAKLQFAGSSYFKVEDKQRPSLKYTLYLPDSHINLWYSKKDRSWIGLQSTLKNGSSLRYQLHSKDVSQ